MKLTRHSCNTGIEILGKPAPKSALRNRLMPTGMLSPGWGGGSGGRLWIFAPGLDRVALGVLNKYPDENAALKSLDCMCQPFLSSISKYTRGCFNSKWPRSGAVAVLALNVHWSWADRPCWTDSKLSSLFRVSTVPELTYETKTNDKNVLTWYTDSLFWLFPEEVANVECCLRPFCLGFQVRSAEGVGSSCIDGEGGCSVHGIPCSWSLMRRWWRQWVPVGRRRRILMNVKQLSFQVIPTLGIPVSYRWASLPSRTNLNAQIWRGGRNGWSIRRSLMALLPVSMASHTWRLRVAQNKVRKREKVPIAHLWSLDG